MNHPLWLKIWTLTSAAGFLATFPFVQDARTPGFINTCLWASVASLFASLVVMNRRQHRALFLGWLAVVAALNATGCFHPQPQNSVYVEQRIRNGDGHPTSEIDPDIFEDYNELIITRIDVDTKGNRTAHEVLRLHKEKK